MLRGDLRLEAPSGGLRRRLTTACLDQKSLRDINAFFSSFKHEAAEDEFLAKVAAGSS